MVIKISKIHKDVDKSKVSKDVLLESTIEHINDVKSGLEWCVEKINKIKNNHDHTKLKYFDEYFNSFTSGINTSGWVDIHLSNERHHLRRDACRIPDDVDLFDVLECMVDGIVAGLARNNGYEERPLPTGLLEKALENTAIKLIKEIKVEM